MQNKLSAVKVRNVSDLRTGPALLGEYRCDLLVTVTTQWHHHVLVVTLCYSLTNKLVNGSAACSVGKVVVVFLKGVYQQSIPIPAEDTNTKPSLHLCPLLPSLVLHYIIPVPECQCTSFTSLRVWLSPVNDLHITMMTHRLARHAEAVGWAECMISAMLSLRWEYWCASGN